MNVKKLAALTAGAALAATTAFAQAQSPVADAIVAELQAAGYTGIEVDTRGDGFQVEAANEAGLMERDYTAAGVLLREEVTVDGARIERVFDEGGNLVSESVDDDKDNDSIGDDENDADDDRADGDMNDGDNDDGDDDEDDNDDGDDDDGDNDNDDDDDDDDE